MAEPNAPQNQPQTQQKPLPKKDNFKSPSILMMAIGAAIAFFPWMSPTGSFWVKFVATIVGLAIAAFGFFKSK